MVDICMLGTTGGMPMIDKFMSAALINFNRLWRRNSGSHEKNRLGV